MGTSGRAFTAAIVVAWLALFQGLLVDLVGGYYDAGDNVKYGLPMAFTVTTLAWSALFYHNELQAAGELENVHAGIRWGTDYFLKCSSRKNRLYVEVGDPALDHQCWVRPENMQTPRTVKQIDENTPGTEIAAETSAAMAASSIVFRGVDRAYSRRLLNKAKLLFQFAKAHKGTYDGECPFYCSYSGYNDELLWAATWLYYATRRPVYMKYILEESISANVAEFSWDLKYAGVQVLLSKDRRIYRLSRPKLKAISAQFILIALTTKFTSPKVVWFTLEMEPTLNMLQAQHFCSQSIVICLPNTTKSSLVETKNSTQPTSLALLGNRLTTDWEQTQKGDPTWWGLGRIHQHKRTTEELQSQY
ncbi:hypothetical protein HS088_TW09G01220 [Tripterygium wilfordii]|uniref:cellulase n=1 Tax=Tripterygium wilfordii TaxID=458696 RepID=A0A7J7D9W4_TRIWF|nr:hypothetical protein HS088_TW09G01220 [Tripterygium wilfordii]